MKSLKSFLVAITLVFGFLTPVFANNFIPQTVNKVLFAKGLKVALMSDNLGVRQGALQQYVMYGQDLKVDQATVFEIVKIYRNSQNEPMRILALSALSSINNSWANDFLERSVKSEKSVWVQEKTRDVIGLHMPSAK
ncbi:MAG TPA: hypothetical protein DIW24_04110 [Bacteroidetes bacterium]|nr:hypothetical protein [Bacteroidota bacterium]HRR08152.1 hypothetical protein [Rhodothermales bacterium]